MFNIKKKTFSISLFSSNKREHNKIKPYEIILFKKNFLLKSFFQFKPFPIPPIYISSMDLEIINTQIFQFLGMDRVV